MNLKPVWAVYETLGAEDTAECKILYVQDPGFSPQDCKRNKPQLYENIINIQLPHLLKV